jgi:folate-binding protein YgfZ
MRNSDMSGQLLISPIERTCIEAVGRDASTYLHSQLSNDIQSMTVGQSLRSFILEPTGKIVALVRVTRLRDDAFLLDMDSVPGLDDIVLARLNKFKIRVDVNFVVSERTCIAIRSLDDRVIQDSIRESLVENCVVVDAWWGDGRAIDVIPVGSHEILEDELLRAHLPNISNGPEELELERVRAGWPAMGHEIVPGETLVAATGLTSVAVNFTKGCYPGQELVERMDSRGSTAPRTLRRIRCDDPLVVSSGPMFVGDSIMFEGSEVGIVTSQAGDLLLAYVSRQVELGEVVSPQN